MASTAVLDQEFDEVASTVEIGAVADDTAVALGPHQAGALQDRQMVRQSALRYVEIAGQLARWYGIRRQPNELPENLQLRDGMAEQATEPGGPWRSS